MLNKTATFPAKAMQPKKSKAKKASKNKKNNSFDYQESFPFPAKKPEYKPNNYSQYSYLDDLLDETLRSVPESNFQKTVSFSELKNEIVNFKGWETLNKKQKDFCLSVLNNENILITGSAGTGKSFVLSFLFNFLHENNVVMGKTSTTGAAALNIGGSTIHSFSGIGLGDMDVANTMKQVYRNKKAYTRIQGTKILFLDEVSMCSGRLLNLVDEVFKKVRRCSLPFGGIQMVFSGDMLQLCPVDKNLLDNTPDFCFKTDSWKLANIKIIHLTEIIRQKDDKEFAKILEQVRFGKTDSLDLLRSRVGAKLNSTGKIQPIRILGYNKAVDYYNQKVLDSIGGKVWSFYSKDNGEDRHIDFFNKNCSAAQKIDLKIGCQVMLLYNVDTENGFVNGSIGKVISIESNCPVVEFSNGKTLVVEPQKWETKEQIYNEETNEMEYKVIASRTQTPLRVAYAISYHKSQGSTLDFAVVDSRQAFTDGMLYVAISRVKTLSGLSFYGDFDASKIKANQECVDFYLKNS